MRSLVSLTLFGIAVCVLSLGCGGGKVVVSKKAKVTGSIKLNGKLLASGRITFDPQNGEPPSDLSILDGKFEGQVILGKNKVMINSYEKKTMKEKTGKDGPGYDQMVEMNLLPDRYNIKSDIFREVADPGPNDFNFDITSTK
jgi:hypothetical protein